METKHYTYYGFARKKRIPDEHGNYVVCFPQPKKEENFIFEIQANNQKELSKKAEFHLIQKLKIQTYYHIPHILKPIGYDAASMCLPWGFMSLADREVIGIAVVI